MLTAVWNDTVPAEAHNDQSEFVEGNMYFLPDVLNKHYSKPC